MHRLTLRNDGGAFGYREVEQLADSPTGATGWRDRPRETRTAWRANSAPESSLTRPRFCREEEEFFGRADYGDRQAGGVGGAGDGQL
jgi:hypothetical protein